MSDGLLSEDIVQIYRISGRGQRYLVPDPSKLLIAAMRASDDKRGACTYFSVGRLNYVAIPA